MYFYTLKLGAKNILFLTFIKRNKKYRKPLLKITLNISPEMTQEMSYSNRRIKYRITP